MKYICERLKEKGLPYSILQTGELFFRRRDGVPMYIREFPHGQYDWTFKGSHNDFNPLEYRAADKRSEEELLAAVAEFTSVEG
jgi:hypothetical protein